MANPDNNPTSFSPCEASSDGKQMWQTRPGPGELPDYDQILAIDQAASSKTPCQTPPVFRDNRGRIWGGNHMAGKRQ